MSVLCQCSDMEQLLAMPTSSFHSRLRTTRLCFLAADMTALANTPGQLAVMHACLNKLVL